MKEVILITILITLVVMLFLAGFCGGVYLGHHIVKSAKIVEWNWYQPSEGPDMGKWKKGSSGGGLAVLIYIVFAVSGSALGLGLGLCLKYLVEEYIYPLIMRMKMVSKVLVVTLLAMGFYYGFYLGRTIVESLMIVNWTAYYMVSWGAWRYQSSWGVVPLSLTIVATVLGSALGLALGLCIGYLAEKCVYCLITEK